MKPIASILHLSKIVMSLSPSVMARYNYIQKSNPFQGLFRTLKGITTLLIILTLSSCGDDDPLAIPDPPSFDWQESIYTNPVPIAEVTEPECDDMPPLNGPEPPFNGYYYYHTSPDPVVWKIKLNKSRRDMIAYVSYVPDLESDRQERTGYNTISIKDLISGEVTLVDEMPQGYHLGFDFAGDYLIYERVYEGYLYNWKTGVKEKLGTHLDDPSISPNAKLISYEDLNFESKGERLIMETESGNILFSVNDRVVSGNMIWERNDVAIHKVIGSKLRRLDLNISDQFQDYIGPFDSGLGGLIGFSLDGNYLYGSNQSISNLNTLKVNGFWHSKAIAKCGNRDLEDFFILPDNTFMMRKTYYISDHEKRIVHPEYHWHLFDANGSNERRVDLQL